MRSSKKKAPILYAFGPGEKEFSEELAKSEVEVRLGRGDKPSLAKSIINHLNGEKDSINRLAFEVDPSQVNNYGGIYQAKLRLVPDSVLKRIAIQDSLVAAIVRARQNHMSSFGRARPDRFSLGFIVKPNTGVLDTMDEKRKDEFSKQVDRSIKLISTCGHTEGVPTDHQKTFSEYLSLSSRSAVVCGRIATEIVWAQDASGERQFSHFVATDAGTIYRATKDKTVQDSVRTEAYSLLCTLLGDDKKPTEEKWNRNEYSWVQVIDGTPKQVFTNDEMRVYNFYPVPDVELGGYPVTPIDTVITAVTTHVNITTHNKLYFQSGRATRGMLVVTSDDVDTGMLSQIKQNFNASINSTSNCLDGSAIVFTKQYGAIRVDELESKVHGQDKIDIWTGVNWEKATAYKTGSKTLALTNANGFIQRTSPDHRFSVINENGDLVWKKQSELNVGDFLAINKKPVDGDLVPQFNGKSITPELMEVFGWMSGDGTLSDREFRLFYHHEKELGIRERHARILREFGVEAKIIDKHLSDEERNSIIKRYGFKSCASVQTSIANYSKDIATKIRSLGFNVSSDGKNIPAWIYGTTDVLRCSYLRGLFSADGNNAKRISPVITISSDAMREQVRLLLGASGIRCSVSEGKSKLKIVGPKRERVEEPSLLRVKDRLAFFDKIGFLQAHKQPRVPKGTNKGWGTSNSISMSVIVRYLRMVKEKTKLPRGGNDHNVGKDRVFTKRQQMDIDAILRGEDSCSLSRLLNYMEVAKVEAPSWMLDFYFEPITGLTNTETQVDMFDVEVYDNTNAFMSLTHRIHNSWRMPVFGIPTDSTLQWQPLDTGGGRDMEFQYLADMNAREILTAFMMSPDELPGYSYLSRGTASQALSESNTEWKMQAARDVGIRPLLAQFEDFINAELFPLIDRDLATKARICLIGLEADTQEKESTRLQTAGQVYMTFDDILQKVEKKPVGKEWGGDFPMNPVYQAIVDKYLYVGDVLEHFFGHQGASKDPSLHYIHDPMWFQYQQMVMQQQMAAQQQQQQAQQPQGNGPQGGGGGGQQGGQQDESGGASRANPQDDQTEAQRTESAQPHAPELGSAVSQAYDLMQKSEDNLPADKRQVLARHKKSLEFFITGFERDVKEGVKGILDLASKVGPRSK